jgi:hypothetical protein
MQGIPHLRNPTAQDDRHMALRSGPVYVVVHGVPEHFKHVLENVAKTVHGYEYVRMYRLCDTYLAIYVFARNIGEIPC